MNTQMIICMVIFAATLVSYMLNKIPMWLTAMISLAALYFTGCIDANGALAGFSNVNTLLMWRPCSLWQPVSAALLWSMVCATAS